MSSDNQSGNKANDPALPATEPGSGDEPPLDGSPTDELEDKRMSLLEHLQELRVRLRNAGIAFLAALILSFVFVREFFAVLIAPTVAGISAATGKAVRLQATTPTEGFWVMMKLAVRRRPDGGRAAGVLGAVEVRRPGPVQERKADGPGRSPRRPASASPAGRCSATSCCPSRRPTS